MNSKAKFNNFMDKNQERLIKEIRKKFSDMYDFIENNCIQSRETSITMTKLEEAQMWAIKGVSREEY